MLAFIGDFGFLARATFGLALAYVLVPRRARHEQRSPTFHGGDVHDA
jgi:hypothetical protein